MGRIKVCGIYQIKSIIHPDRIYIGSSVNINKRWSDHKWKLNKNVHDSPKLQYHYNKYGLKDLIFDILESFDFTSLDYLIYREQYYMSKFKHATLKIPWFNVNEFAGSRLGTPCSEETKQKLSIASKGRLVPPDIILKRTKMRTYTKLSEETRKKISASLIGKKVSAETRLRMSLALKGKITHSPENRLQISISEKRTKQRLKEERSKQNGII